MSAKAWLLIGCLGGAFAFSGCVSDGDEGSSVDAPASTKQSLQQGDRVASASAASTPRMSSALAAIKGSERVRLHETFQVPNFFWVARPAGANVLRSTRPELPSGPDLSSNVLEIERAARAHLMAHRELYRLSEADIDNAILERVHDTGEGGVSASFTQQHAGEEVFGLRMTVMMERDLEAIAISGFLSSLANPDGDGAAPFARGEQEAIGDALAAVGVRGSALDLERIEARAGYARYELAARDLGFSFRSPARIKRVYHPQPHTLVPAYEIELDVRSNEQGDLGYRVIVSAVDGEVLERESLIHNDAYTYRVWVDADGAPYSNPFGLALKPYLSGFFPTDYVSPRDVTLESRNMRGDAWLPSNAQETIGNNVTAYADISGRDGFDGSDEYGTATAPSEFLHVYDFGRQPAADSEQLQAPVVHLFYTLNFMHDLFYDFGFDEAAGNAQLDNFNRGGRGEDPILAESLDSSGTNNANMFTPSDGSSPRMQMYRFNYSSADRLSITSPGELAGAFPIGVSGVPEVFDLSGRLVAASDATAPSDDGCEPFDNGADIAGHIAFIDRGTCSFLTKVQNAEAAGAVGVVISNNDTQRPDRVFDMGGFDQSVSIPSVMVSYLIGQQIRQQLAVPTEVDVRMQTLPHQDASLDSDIVIHEWGHYMFGRLTAGGGSDQLGGINEGNSDYVALLMAAREQDVMIAGNDMFQGAYPMGQYAGHRYWTGFRRAAYSTDMMINPLTFRHISDRSPVPPELDDGTANSEVHNSGEVWANAMWECHAALLNEHGFQDGRQRSLGYLVAGLKLFPRDATFVEARDAILAAIRATDEDDFRTCFYTFAKRGMGVGARAPARYTTGNIGVVESFSVGGALALSYLELRERESCDDDGYLDVGERAEISVEIVNEGAEALSGVTVRLEVFSNGNENIPRRGVSFPEGDTETLPDLQPFGLARVTIPISLDEALGSDLLSYRIVAEHPDAVATAVLADGVLINTDVQLAASTLDDVEFGEGDWVRDRDATLGLSTGWAIASSNANSYWFGEEVDYKTDIRLVTPRLLVSAAGDFTIRFDHRHDFEFGQYAWDGAVVEVSVDDGVNWKDVTDYGVDARYNGVLANGATLFGSPAANNNPLSDRDAYTGTNPSYPDFDTVTLKLGDSLAGKTVRVRFRLGTDEGTSGNGWDLDNLEFEGIDNMPFPALVDEDSLCGAGPKPTARAGADRVVTEGEEVILDASATLNPAGGGLTYKWVRLGGPMIMLEGEDQERASFVAPRVDEPTDIDIQLSVSDGSQESFDDITITVRPVNDIPTASIEVVGELLAGETITLDGSGSEDLDGDTLTFAWAQTEGPGVVLEGATTAKPTFVVPALEEATTLGFQLIVSDGSSISAPASVSVEIPATEPEPMEMTPEDDKGKGSGEEEGRCSSAPPAGQPGVPAALPALVLGAIASRRRRRLD
ncbi:MAG: M36 family metallopeptidase [Myxococcota bacterium]|nr:M36 family metallopeptidase [Myxococcota bacterium]